MQGHETQIATLFVAVALAARQLRSSEQP